MDQQQAALIERVGDGILQVAEQQERQLDAQIEALENMNDDDFEVLRQKRRLQLQKKMRQEQDWAQLGHGRYLELTDTKEFFNAAKKSQRMVVHFFRSVTPRCEIVDAHLSRLAPKHLETRFVKLDAEKNPFLVEKFGIILMPTIVLIKDGRTDHAIHGFDEFGGTDDFTTDDVAYVLSTYKMLNFEIDRSEAIAAQGGKAGVNAINIKTGVLARGMEDDDDDDY